MTIGGAVVECDTPQEAAVLIRSFKGSDPQGPVERPKDKKSVQRPFQRVQPEQSAASLFPHKAGYNFKRAHKAVLEALKSAYPNGVTSDELASQTGLRKTSLPIVMVGLRTYAKKRGFAFEDLIRRSENPLIGTRGSVYTFTEKGLKEFF